MTIQMFKVRGPRKFMVKRLNGIKVGSLGPGTKIEEIRLKSAFSLEGKIPIFGPDKPVK